MHELDAENANAKPSAAEAKEDKTVEDIEAKPANKSLVNVSASATPGSGSEASFVAPEDEDTLTSSDTNFNKTRTPRKLIEDEKRATGRIAWPVWRAYFKVNYKTAHLVV